MTKSRSMFRFSILVLAAPLVGVTATSALAAEPTTVDEARAAAEHSEKLAAHYDNLGGVGYKAGLVQSSEAEAHRYSVLADELASPPESVPTPAEQRVQKQLQFADDLAGTGVKTGLLEEAQAAQDKLTGSPADQPNPSCMPTKPSVPCPD
jgi:ABC-type sugar transport system substrate-binding protein